MLSWEVFWLKLVRKLDNYYSVSYEKRIGNSRASLTVWVGGRCVCLFANSIGALGGLFPVDPSHCYKKRNDTDNSKADYKVMRKTPALNTPPSANPTSYSVLRSCLVVLCMSCFVGPSPYAKVRPPTAIPFVPASPVQLMQIPNIISRPALILYFKRIPFAELRHLYSIFIGLVPYLLCLMLFKSSSAEVETQKRRISVAHKDPLQQVEERLKRRA